MATLALAAAGAAAGSALLPTGISVFGATVSGAVIGQQLGALAGSYVDQALFGASGQSRTFTGPRLSDLTVTASSEGAAIPRLYGRARLGGQVIWATNFEEEVIKSKSGGNSGGGKGGGGGTRASGKKIDYRYYGNFAVALAEGEIASVSRVWANGSPLDLSQFTYRVYTGSETQLPDSLIEAKEGTGNAPAYRGVAYIVFERMPLAEFGNRLPQLSFEINRPVDRFHEQVRAVVVIPGSGEFAYGTDIVNHQIAGGQNEAENVHTRQGGTDWTVSLDQMQASLPNAKAVSLVVSWFGTDLRAGQCQLRPGVELASKVTTPTQWIVAGQSRATAHLISVKNGKAAYGGTPSDASVISAIQDLKARGIAVTFSPFILMDVADGNTLADPYTATPGQPSYPWRGRITIYPAAGVAGSPDGSAAAATQVTAFVGTAQVSDFSIVNGTVVYSGPAEWSFRRMILHNAFLCKAAGGVDAFVLLSEMRGMTWVRSDTGSYPFVDALVQLAADVRAVLGSTTKITYAADWSEYFGHQPADGSGDVNFHLDPLWASPNIDAIGIDVYWPLADWRDGETHLDWLAGTRSIYELDYLKGNLFAGEGYDYYYASAADRDSQTKAAGGVDAFVLLSEMRGMTWVRSDTGSYPFVDALVQLAADVRAVLGSTTKITYAADWSEYFGHQPADGSGDVNFHLDPLWASPNIDAIGIDVYWPLADWRDGETHLDWLAGTRSIYELDYLKGNLFAGEGYDYYYASAADRDSQTRTAITDGAGKPWVYRFKDLKSWWQNQHFDRPGGVESPTATPWVPQSKPIWFMELGCPAVDKGANQPNVFVDPKSSESGLPYFSDGSRDDLMQRRFLQAFFDAFDPVASGYVAGANPVSGVYGDRMIDLTRMHVYAWDARPYPAFPFNSTVWGDAGNWRLGHWLNGRVASLALSDAVAAVVNDYDFTSYDATALFGIVPGFVIDRVMAAREALQPLELAYFFDSVESGNVVRFQHRGAAEVVDELRPEELVETSASNALYTLTRAQETDLPASAKVSYTSAVTDYRPAVAEARRLVGASGRIALADLPLVMDAEQAGGIAESWLFETWSARERAGFSLPPSRLALEPGDALQLNINGRTQVVRLIGVADHGAREIEALSLDRDVYSTVEGPSRPGRIPLPSQTGSALGIFLDLPLLRGDETPEAGYVAALKTPWPGLVAFYRSPETTGYVLNAIVAAPAITGTLLGSLPAGPAGRWDRATKLQIKLDHGELSSVTSLALFSGGNAAAVQADNGEWEVVQFLDAVLIGPQTYELTTLLRAQAGTESAMQSVTSAGARFVLLDSALAPVDMTSDDIGLPYNWTFGPANRDIGDSSYQTRQHSFAGIGLRPLSPVHLRARHIGNDIEISWIRRTRIGGDGWEQIEVPLGEDTEQYEVDILEGGVVKRTLSTSAPVASYSAAQQIADFGALQTSLEFRAYQIGNSFGRGAQATGTL